MTASAARYSSERASFLEEQMPVVVGRLASFAAAQGLHVESEQHEEWEKSIGVLQAELADRMREIEILKTTLRSPELAQYHHVILEYDFRRRGLRLDCVLLGSGIIVVVEFKRSKIVAADREQVATYGINLVEFHGETRRLTRFVPRGDLVDLDETRTPRIYDEIAEHLLRCGVRTCSP